MNTAPLAGVRVIAVDSFMAVPSAAAFLADLGADVIKIEPLSGDPARRLSRVPRVEGELKNYDVAFDVDNRGKRSLALNLGQPGAREIMDPLLEESQIFMCNLLPKRQEKFGLDPQRIFKVNPGIVHATLTGYGTEGPDANKPGFDITAFFGRSGLSDTYRDGRDSVTIAPRPAQGDHTAGMAFTIAILSALRAAEQTGAGQTVETSLFETAVWTQAYDFATTLVDEAPVPVRSRSEPLNVANNHYECADGKWIIIAVLHNSGFATLCRALGTEDWPDDPRYASASDRVRYSKELTAKVEAVLKTKTRDEWGARFDEVGLIWGPILSVDEVVHDKQAHAIDLFPELSHPAVGTYNSIRIPMRSDSLDVQPRGPAPTLGQHTREILAKLDITDDRINELIESGVLGK